MNLNLDALITERPTYTWRGTEYHIRGVFEVTIADVHLVQGCADNPGLIPDALAAITVGEPPEDIPEQLAMKVLAHFATAPNHEASS